MMVGRNAAWRHWCRERTPEEFPAKRLQFHHSVRKKKQRFGKHGCKPRNAWRCRTLPLPQGMSAGSLASRNPLPHCTRNTSPEGGCLEGNARSDAWHSHFRDVPAPAAAPPVSSHDTDDPNLTERVRNLRGAMSRIAGQLQYAFSEPELLQVLPELPPGGVFRVDDDVCRAAQHAFNAGISSVFSARCAQATWSLLLYSHSLLFMTRVTLFFFFFPVGLFRLHDGMSSRFQGRQHCAAVCGRFMSGRAGGWPARCFFAGA